MSHQKVENAIVRGEKNSFLIITGTFSGDLFSYYFCRNV